MRQRKVIDILRELIYLDPNSVIILDYWHATSLEQQLCGLDEDTDSYFELYQFYQATPEDRRQVFYDEIINILHERSSQQSETLSIDEVMDIMQEHLASSKHF